jgi:hypothetical protein
VQGVARPALRALHLQWLAEHLPLLQS